MTIWQRLHHYLTGAAYVSFTVETTFYIRRVHRTPNGQCLVRWYGEIYQLTREISDKGAEIILFHGVVPVDVLAGKLTSE